MAQISRKQAADFVGKIRRKNGGITEDERRTWPADAIEMISNLRRQLAASTRTLATNLYSSDARFLYELIQNAEDNTYTKAACRGEQPFLQFNVYLDKIYVDSNEDGFEEEHVRAICSIGESSKQNVQGYIGEKGIGFKSIFKIAKKVHIQSGPFSFSFTHTMSSDEDGLGMVTPYEQPHLELPSGVTTRFTLTPRDDSSFQQRVADIEALPKTFLLFLSKLKTIGIKVHSPNNAAKTTSYSTATEPGSNLETIVTTNSGAYSHFREEHKFHVTRKVIENLPGEPARPDIRAAEVVLAFPIDNNDVPIETQQYTYAYLPLRNLGFNFVIQSDFITQASREDLFDSPWNRALRKGVAEAFRDAVLGFCQHPKLQYTWMRYLPSESIADDFWKRLRSEIHDLLRGQPILRSRTRRLHQADRLKIVTWDAVDDRGDPLFRDIEPEIYLAADYALADQEKLKPLGLAVLTVNDFLARFRADLSRSDSIFKAKTTSSAWHARLANSMCMWMDKGWNISDIRQLAILPLQQGTWITASDGNIYYPDCEGVRIPSDVDLQVIEPAVCTTDRNHLWDKLGVRNLSPPLGLQKVVARYRGPTASVNIDQSISHMRFLFWHMTNLNILSGTAIYAITTHGRAAYFMRPNPEHLYFPRSADTFDAKALLPDPAPSGSYWSFINERYLYQFTDNVVHHGRSWMKFLETVVTVTHHPQLLRGTRDLSYEMQHLIDAKPDKLVAVLWKYQELYSPDITSVRQKLMNASVPLENTSRKPLKETVFPLASFKQTFEVMGLASFPFLAVPTQMRDVEPSELAILSRLGVETSEGLSLFIKIIEYILSTSSRTGTTMPSGLVSVYEKLNEYSGGNAALDRLRRYFADEKRAIFCRPLSASSSCWYLSKECVWQAPEWLTRFKCLSRQSEYHRLRDFFCTVLVIRDYRWQDAIEELKYMRSGRVRDAVKAQTIYEHLYRDFVHEGSLEVLRQAFEDSELIYSHSTNSWHRPSHCVWADGRIPIPDLTAISLQYPNLERFFKTMLSVQSPDLSMHVRALVGLGRRPPEDPTRVKEAVFLISSLNPTEADLQALSASNIFHVRLANGHFQWTNKAADFSINDRRHHAQAFRNKVAVLDFTLEEARVADAFFRALGMANKYFSASVSESTRVADGNRHSRLTQSFQSRAFAICRYAVHHRSPLVATGHDGLMRRLQTVSVLTSSSISRQLSLFQYGREVIVDLEAGSIHLKTEDEGLQIYLPWRGGDRDLCLKSQIPKRMMSFLGITDPAAEAVLGNIINLKRLSSVVALLQNEGVVDVDGLTPTDLDDEDEHSDNESEVNTLGSTLVMTPASTPRPTPQLMPYTPPRSGSRRPEYGALDPGTPTFTHTIPADPPTGQVVEALSPLHNRAGVQTGYSAILERVRSASDGLLPGQGTVRLYPTGATPTQLAVTFESLFPSRSMDRDRKVGAAGELFVFELLKAQEFLNYAVSNWRSTIRKEVRAHSDYQDLEPWNGAETADIVYDDTERQLGGLLNEGGYHFEGLMEGKKFFIEVKTTTGGCGETFFMSGSQYQRMQRRDPGSVYVLFRVFNIDKAEIGLKIFVDPEAARQRGELNFTVDTWAVRAV